MTLLTLEAPRSIESAVLTLRHGGVLALPTDTVYGLAASLDHPDAIARLFSIKDRAADKTIPVLIASLAALNRITEAADPLYLALLRRFWPGPLTAAVPARPGLPEAVLAADGTVGVRMPNHSVALAILERCGGALAVTSANHSGEAPACTAEEIESTLGETVDLILDGGVAPCGLPSTVIRREGDTISVVRAGAIPESTLVRAWQDLTQDHPVSSA